MTMRKIIIGSMLVAALAGCTGQKPSAPQEENYRSNSGVVEVAGSLYRATDIDRDGSTDCVEKVSSGTGAPVWRAVKAGYEDRCTHALTTVPLTPPLGNAADRARASANALAFQIAQAEYNTK